MIVLPIAEKEVTKKDRGTYPHPLKFLCLKKFPETFCHAATFENSELHMILNADGLGRRGIPTPSPSVTEVVTGMSVIVGKADSAPTSSFWPSLTQSRHWVVP